MKISHSKMETYKQCPKKYYYKYVEKLEKDITHTPFLFGGALDNTFNYILTCKQKSRPVKSEVAQWIFVRNMKKWYGQNPLSFFKAEKPPGAENPTDWEVWNHLCYVGNRMITTYIDEILPKFKTILGVQLRKEVPNDDGDILVMIADFTAELEDGTIAVMDNKSASKPYPKNCVKDSPQLAIYAEQLQKKYAGYVVLEKTLKDDNVVWKMHVDEVQESLVEEIYDEMSTVVGQIKAEIFPKNAKSCFAYGKPCDFAAICKYNKMTGLIKK
jgi:hypothetical protein